MDLRRQYFSRSSSHGVENSIPQPPTQPCTSHLISSTTESNRQHNLCMVESAREIRESCERILKLLQEEIDATKSMNDVLLTSDDILPFVEQIEEHSITNESVQVKNSIVTSIPLDETLPSMEPFEKQSAGDESGVVRTSMVEAWTPMCEILGKPLVSSPLLIQDASYTVSDGFDLTYGIVANPPPTPEPPDRVETPTVQNSNSFANDLGIWLTLRLPEKPPNFDLSSLNFVDENRYGFSINGVCPASGLTSLHVIVLYHISSVMWVSFTGCLNSLMENHEIIEVVFPIILNISDCLFSCVIRRSIIVIHAEQRSIINACNMFDILPQQSVVIWSGLIDGCVIICMHKLASYLLLEMVQLGNHNAYSTYEHMNVENYVIVLPVYIIGGSKATIFQDARLYTRTLQLPKPSDRSFQKICLEFQVTGNLTMAPPPPEPPDVGHKRVNANAIYHGSRFVVCYEVVIFSYWIGPHIMQENRALIDELLHATRCITGTYDQIALLDLCSKIGDVGTTQQGWHGLLKIILDCSNSLFVGYIKIGELDGKELLSYKFVSKCWFVMAIQVVYGNFYPLRLICGCSFD